MSGTAFPTLAVSPDLPLQRKPRSNTISSESEAGYKQSRPRFTRQPYDIGPVKYSVLTADEKDDIQEHFDSHGCSVVFPYTMPGETAARNVRYKDPGPLFSLVAPSIWSAEFELEEV